MTTGPVVETSGKMEPSSQKHFYQGALSTHQLTAWRGRELPVLRVCEPRDAGRDSEQWRKEWADL